VDAKDSSPNPTPPDSPAPARPPASPRSAAASRDNGRRSRGPKTPQGKARSSLNALKHGFWSRDLVNPLIDGKRTVADFNALLAELIAGAKPSGALEEILVEEIAACYWRLRRALRFESRSSWHNEESDRYQDDNDDPISFPSATAEDNWRERDRRNSIIRKTGLDRLVLPDSDDLIQILRFETVLKRRLFRAIDNLQRLQAARRRASRLSPRQEERNEKQSK